MDMNGNADSIMRDLPMGFAFALARNEAAMQRYTQMTESEKEQIILKCKDARSKAEMQKLVDSLVPDGGLSSVYAGPRAE
ncbi:MAG: hypothetical protein IJN16_00515 [Lachnospiraceae bacterium]|nr:hypothetical protein [Lachnospiraceae bacterium]